MKGVAKIGTKMDTSLSDTKRETMVHAQIGNLEGTN